MQANPSTTASMLTASWPSSLRRALQVAANCWPDEAQRAAATLPLLLAGWLSEREEREQWQTSHLTEDGFPVEFTFTSSGGGLRYTVEATSPNHAPAARLDETLAALGRLGALPIPAAAAFPWRQMQASGALRYGAWVGVRHHGRHDIYKLYVEVPRDADALARSYVEGWLGRFPTIQGRPILLRMIGYYPHSGEIELYFRVLHMRSWELRALLSPIGLEARQDELLNALQLAYGRPIWYEMPGATFGFSYALRSGQPAVFSLYTFARTMFGGSARTREQTLHFSRQCGWDLNCYAEMSAPLASAGGRSNAHGMFGLAVGAEGPPQMHIGLRPPEEAP